MNDVTIKLLAQISQFTALDLIAVLKKMKLDHQGVHEDCLEEAKVRSGESFTFDFQVSLDATGKLKDVEDFQIDIFSVVKSGKKKKIEVETDREGALTRKFIMSTGPLSDLSDELIQLNITKLLKSTGKAEISKIIYITPDGYSLSSNIPTVVEQFDAVINDDEILRKLLKGKAGIKDEFVNQLLQLIADDVKLKYFYRKLRTILLQQADANDLDKFAALHPVQWFSSSMVRRYIFARIFEKLYEIHQNAWFAIFTGSEKLADDNALLILNEVYARQRIGQCIDDRQVPEEIQVADGSSKRLLQQVAPIAELAESKREQLLSGDGKQGRNEIQSVLAYLKEGFDDSEYDFEEAKAYIVAQLKKNPGSDLTVYRNRRKEILEALIDYIASKEMKTKPPIKVNPADRALSPENEDSENNDDAILKGSIKHLVKENLTSTLPHIQALAVADHKISQENKEKLEEHLALVDRISAFSGKQQYRMTEYYGVGNALLSNFPLLDHIVELRDTVSIGKIKITNLPDLSMVELADWGKWLGSSPQRNIVLTHLGYKDDDLSDKKIKTKHNNAIVHYASTSLELLCRLFPNKNFVATSKKFNLSSNQKKAFKLATSFFSREYSKQINIAHFSPSHWARIEAQLTSDNLSDSERDKIKSEIREVKAWQLAHSVLHDRKNHIKAAKLKGIIGKHHNDEAGRNPIKDLLLIGEVKFVDEWIKIESPDPDDSSTLVKQIISAAEAKAIFKKAKRQTYYSFLKQAATNQQLATSSTIYERPRIIHSLIGGYSPSAKKPVSWDSLFSTKDNCECDHAESVLSPSAYVVDQLNWLNTITGHIDDQILVAKDLLLGKRPDLNHISLSKNNTLTTMPYIDIVNEVLERQVYDGPQLFLDPQDILKDSYRKVSRIETSGSSDERERKAEIIQKSVFDRVYSKNLISAQGIHLPYDFWMDSARLWLKEIDTEIHELHYLSSGEYTVTEKADGTVNAVRDFGLPPRPIDATNVIVRGALDSIYSGEYFNLSFAEKRLLNGTGYSSDKVYGAKLPHIGKDIPALIEILVAELHLEDQVETENYRLLLEILSTRFVQATAVDNKSVQIKFVEDNCSLAKGNAELINFSYDTYKRLFVFSKLLGKLGWRPWQLDWVISQNNVTLDDDLIRNIEFALRIKEALDISLSDMLAICFGHYTDRYKNDAEPEEEKHKIIFNADRDWNAPLLSLLASLEGLDVVSQDIGWAYSYWKSSDSASEHFFIHSGIRSALAHYFKITELEIDSIALILNISADTRITPVHLQNIHKLVITANALEIPLVTLCQFPEFRDTFILEDIAGFLKWILQLRSCRELVSNYPVMLDLFDADQHLFPVTNEIVTARLNDQKQINLFLQELVHFFATNNTDALMEKYAIANSGYSEEISRAVSDIVSQADDEGLSEVVDSLISESSWKQLDGVTAHYLFDVENKEVGDTDNTLGKYTSGHVVLFPATDISITIKPSIPDPNDSCTIESLFQLQYAIAEDSFQYLLSKDTTYLITVICTNEFEIEVESLTDISNVNCWYFPKTMPLASGGSFDMDRRFFVSLFTGVFEPILRLLWLLRRFSLSVRDLNYLSTKSEFGTVSLNDLVNRKYSKTDLVSVFYRLASYAKLKKSVNGIDSPTQLVDGSILPYNVASSPLSANDHYVQMLSQALNVDASDINAMMNADDMKSANLVIGGNNEPAYKLYNSLPELLLAKTVAWAVKFRSSPSAPQYLLNISDIEGVVDPAIMGSMALVDKKKTLETIMLGVGKYLGDDKWLESQKTVEDRLRSGRRDALLDFLLSGNSFNHPKVGRKYHSLDELSRELLIPVEIAPCRKTSRIREAISVIQRFMQLCKLGHIKEISLSENNLEEWDTFRQSYRIWEVNRKILLFPDEYLLPNLRIKKTPLFSQSESELEQDEATQDTAETVVINYVRSLHEISSLEMVAVLNHTLDTGEQVTLLFARTKSNPHKYYFSSLMTYQSNSNWTPWYEIAVDIEGEHLLPVIHNGHLFLFWPGIKVVTDKTAKEEEPKYRDNDDVEPQKFEVKLNYTRLDVVVDNQFPNRIKWDKKKQSKQYVEVLIENDAAGMFEKLDLAEKKYRIHMLSNKMKGAMFNNLNIDIGYWESLPEGEALELHWNNAVLEKALADIENTIRNEMKYEFVSGNMRVEITTEGDNVPNSGWGVFDDFVEGVYDAGATVSNTVLVIYNYPYSNPSFPHSDYMEKVIQLFFNGPEMREFRSALEGGNRENADVHLGQLKAIAAQLDAGKDFQLSKTISSAVHVTEKTKVTVKTGFSLEEIVDELSLNINFVYENSYGSRFQLYKKESFVLNACGDLHIQEISPGKRSDEVGYSERHETPETSILNQRLYQDKGNRLSIYENMLFSSESLSESRQVLFSNTPSKFALVTDPKNVPFRISEGGMNNFVFQDADNSFLLIPTISYRGIYEGFPVGVDVSNGEYYYEPELRGQNDLSGFMRGDYNASIDSRGQVNNPKIEDVDRGTRKNTAQLLFNSGDNLSATVSAVVQDRSARAVLSSATGISSNRNNVDRMKILQIDEESVALSNETNATNAVLVKNSNYMLLPLYHSHACSYLSQMSVAKKGVHFLLSQMGHQGEIPWGVFTISLFESGPHQYNVTSTNLVDYSEAERSVYFDRGHLYSAYNHELFFHLPFLIAVNFSDNGRYEDAYRWFHYIFDPRPKSGQRAENEVWGFLPFKQESDVASHQDRADVSIDDPFNPHAIAEIDREVYKKAVFYKYIDNLIAWADSQFIRFTGESLDRAENLYRDVWRLLGRRPMGVIKSGSENHYSYSQLNNAAVDSGNGFDPLGIAIEDIPDETVEENWNSSAIDEVVLAAAVPENYFCRPSSEKLNEYFQLVQQRLFNLNHCRDIDGNLREVPLFQPPISPWLLVRARAAGLDIGSVLSYQADAAGYRWEFLQQKANEYTEFAARLADKLQSALEKHDAAVLTELRESHQHELLKKIRLLRRMNIKDAEIYLQQVERNKESIEFRQEFYAGRPKVISGEREEVEKNKQAFGFDTVAQSIETLTAALALIPQFHTQAMVPGTSWGGYHLAQAGRAMSSGARLWASILRHESYLAGVSASRKRRYDDWQFQAKSAKKELRQVEQQILSAMLRINIAEQELENIELQLEQSEIVIDVLKNQFSNEEFYEWQVKEVMKIYRNAYFAAFDMAKRAEAAYLRDTLKQDDRIIEAGNWSSERKGLGGTEKLLSQLKQLDESYWLNINTVNQVSKRLSVAMALNFPEQLAELKTFGECDLDIKGYIFDMHWPDHYYRRIKSVSITIPCIKGPYHPINARLTLTKSNIRTKAETISYEDNRDNYFNNINDVFRKFAETNDANQDTGRLQFDDGNRLLNAFEGAGLDHSVWNIKLSRDFNTVDFSTITDVILTFEYTSRKSETRATNLEDIKTAIQGEISEVKQLVSAKEFFSEAWQAFIKPVEGVSDIISVNTMMEKLAGIQISSLEDPVLTAYYVLENQGLDSSTIESCTIKDADFKNLEQGTISLSTIWDSCPGYGERESLEKDRLKDILLFYIGKQSRT